MQFGCILITAVFYSAPFKEVYSGASMSSSHPSPSRCSCRSGL